MSLQEVGQHPSYQNIWIVKRCQSQKELKAGSIFSFLRNKMDF